MNKITNERVLQLLPVHQQRIIVSYSEGEFNEVMESITKLVEALPDAMDENYDPDKDNTAWLHYFYGGHDWWIQDFDSVDEIFFGFACLNQDIQMAEFGTSYIDDLVRDNQIELDFFWTPKDIHEAVNDKYPGRFNRTKSEANEKDKP